ncbi:hypothetical protein ACLKA7_016136 [Drosophila subpalustris]
MISQRTKKATAAPALPSPSASVSSLLAAVSASFAFYANFTAVEHSKRSKGYTASSRSNEEAIEQSSCQAIDKANISSYSFDTLRVEEEQLRVRASESMATVIAKARLTHHKSTGPEKDH